MKFAISLRGISYHKDYCHDHRPGMTPYTIDFSLAIPHLIKNIIEPLRNSGNEVDIFFVTYPTEKLDDYIQQLQPKKVVLKQFNPNITSGHNFNIFQTMIDAINVVEEYSTSLGVPYDFTIITRFDLIMIENILKVYLEPTGVSVPTYRDDMFFVIGKNLNTKVSNHLQHMQRHTRLITHDYTDYLTKNGIPCHTMYIKQFDNNNYPFHRNLRNIFVEPGHHYFNCTFSDIFNPDSKHYGFRYEPFSTFHPCYN